MKLENMDAFQQEYLRAALMVSLLSVWVLVGLFYYLNRYTRREYFTIWTAGWLFYALWLTLGMQDQQGALGRAGFMLKQSCVGISAVFLLWGSLRFLNLPARPMSLGLFMLFLVVWTFVCPQIVPNLLMVEIPVFILLGLGSIFAGSCFFRMRRKVPFVGAGMLALGFLLWGFYLGSYPLSQQYKNLHSAGFFVAAVLQLFIAVSMIVLVLEETRHHTEEVKEEIAAVRSEREALQSKILTSEERCRTLYDQICLTEGSQKAYDELRRTQQVVVQQERLRALGQMASGIAHDINNALCPITCYSDILLSTEPNLSETASQYLRNISKSAQDIAQIVSRTREFYRRRSDSEPLVDVDINSVVDEVIELTRPRWRDIPHRQGISINVQRDLEPDLPRLQSDPCELREAFTNLIFNCVDAMPQGGTIIVRTRFTGWNGPEESDDPEREIRVEVIDDGIGMDENVHKRCLEPFFSTKAHRGGSGLGLAMVYGVMQRQKGDVQINSTPGVGTCVRLTFPVQSQAIKTAASTQPPKTAPSRSLRILCIDDEPMVGQLMSDCLRQFNHEVKAASGGKHGLELFRSGVEQKEPFDIIITDLGMPEMDGHQVARAIKAESPHTPIIMLTGWGTMIKEDGQASPDVDAVVGKPPQMRDLNKLLLQMTAIKS